MYNENLKNQYIEYLLGNGHEYKDVDKERMHIQNFFDRSEPIEEDINKDIGFMNFKELMILLSFVCKGTFQYQTVILSKFRRYIDWCIETGNSLDYENRLEGVKPSDIDTSLSYSYSYIKNIEQLEEYLDICLMPVNDDTIDNVYRVVILLLYEGFTLDEIINMPKKCFNSKENSIEYSDKKIFLSEYSVNALKYLLEMTEFVAATGDNSFRRIQIVDTGHLIERTVSTRDSMKTTFSCTICNKLAKIKDIKDSPISLTITNINYSGIFYRIYKNELKNSKLDFTEYINYSRDNQRKELYAENLISHGKIEYETWKRAFNL